MNKSKGRLPLLWNTADNIRTVSRCIITVCIIMAVIFSIVTANTGTKAATGDDIGDQNIFPEVTLTDIRNNSNSVSDSEIFADSPLTVVNLWETSCGFCIQEMPDINKAAKHFEGKVRIIGICYDTRIDGEINPNMTDTAKQIMDIRGVDYDNYIPDETFQHYLEGLDYFSGFPTTFFVDSNMNIVKVVTGSLSYDGWINTIDSLLD